MKKDISVKTVTLNRIFCILDFAKCYKTKKYISGAYLLEIFIIEYKQLFKQTSELVTLFTLTKVTGFYGLF